MILVVAVASFFLVGSFSIGSYIVIMSGFALAMFSLLHMYFNGLLSWRYFSTIIGFTGGLVALKEIYVFIPTDSITIKNVTAPDWLVQFASTFQFDVLLVIALAFIVAHFVEENRTNKNIIGDMIRSVLTEEQIMRVYAWSGPTKAELFAVSTIFSGWTRKELNELFNDNLSFLFLGSTSIIVSFDTVGEFIKFFEQDIGEDSECSICSDTPTKSLAGFSVVSSDDQNYMCEDCSDRILGTAVSKGIVQKSDIE